MKYLVRFRGGPRDGEARFLEFAEPPADTLVEVDDSGYLVTHAHRLAEWSVAEARHLPPPRELGAAAQRPRVVAVLAEWLLPLGLGAAFGASAGVVLLALYWLVGFVVGGYGYTRTVILAAFAGAILTLILYLMPRAPE